MSDPRQYRNLIKELEEAVGDSPDDLDWTEELFGRAAQALRMLTSMSREVGPAEREAIAEVLNGHAITRGMQVASGVTCACNEYWTGDEPEEGKRPLPWGRDRLDMHRADLILTAGYHL